MALRKRDICRVGDSPTRSICKRSTSPRRMMSIVTEDDSELSSEMCASKAVKEPQSSPKTYPKHVTSPSRSTPSSPGILRSSQRSERQMLANLSDRRYEKYASIDAQDTPCSQKQKAWKTSKFFSRSMASGELLKGFKKLSTTPPNKEGESSNSDPLKSFKNRFSSLRRKSGSDTDTVPAVDDESLKHGSLEVRGIVCKKDDILSLLNEVSREKRLSPIEGQASTSTSTFIVPDTSSPSHVAPHCSYDTAAVDSKANTDAKSPVTPQIVVQCEKSGHRPKFKTLVKAAISLPSTRPKDVKDDLYIKKSSFLDVVPETKRRLSGPLIEVRGCTSEKSATDNLESETIVQWDETNFVDPCLLGGVIEAYLKDKSASCSSGGKHVSFKKC